MKKYNIDKDKLHVLYVGRVDPEKSIEKVIRAFAANLGNKFDGKEMEMIIVGDGIDKSRLEHLVGDLQVIENVKFLGKVLGDDLVELYRVGDVFVTASETETQGLVLVEAAAMGLPIIAVDAGAVKEVCQNGKNGFLCSGGKEAEGEISKAIINVLADAEMRKKMSECSKEIASHHDLNRTLDRFEEIYKIAVDLKKVEN